MPDELKNQEKAMSGQEDATKDGSADVRPDDSAKAKASEEKQTSEGKETKAEQEKKPEFIDVAKYNKLKSKLQKAEDALGRTSTEYQSLKAKMQEMESKVSEFEKAKGPDMPKEWEGVEPTFLADPTSPEYQKQEFLFTQKITSNVKSVLNEWWKGQEDKKAESAKARLARESADAVESVNEFVENFRESNNISDRQNRFIEQEVLRETPVPKDVSPEYFKSVLEKRKKLYREIAIENGWAKDTNGASGITGSETDPEKVKQIEEAKRHERNNAAFIDQAQPDGAGAEKPKSGLTSDLEKEFLTFMGVNRKSPFQ